MGQPIIHQLIQNGVTIIQPESVFISEDVDPSRISAENVTIYPGTKIIGPRSLILPDCQIGYEAPVCLENTCIGPGSRLNGGFFKEAVFLGNNTFGSGAHVRQGTILEEYACAAHTVGLKQTILFPFVTLGSLINFCDCFMAGGTDRVNHSEVGSSFIHFNYTPNQDKATASMFGDVHNGVLLDSNPVFLGGQGGVVGPVQIAYGCISGAGSILRKNQLEPDRLLLGGAFKEISMPRTYDIYTNVAHIFNNNIDYMAGLVALSYWYAYVRSVFATDPLSCHLIHALKENLNACIQERIYRFNQFLDKLSISKEKIKLNSKKESSGLVDLHDAALNKQEQFNTRIQAALNDKTLCPNGSSFVDIIQHKMSDSGDVSYLSVIKDLNKDQQTTARNWLKSICDSFVSHLHI
jgi:hypothetical protein